VSVNTIGTHLRSAFAKLGIQSRVQLGNVLRHELSAAWEVQAPEGWLHPNV
jgi:DNA-binding CsgD family transcriptional regulator